MLKRVRNRDRKESKKLRISNSKKGFKAERMFKKESETKRERRE